MPLTRMIVVKEAQVEAQAHPPALSSCPEKFIKLETRIKYGKKEEEYARPHSGPQFVSWGCRCMCPDP
ncbi:hypothetical protein QR680_007411 [Steinernema hermaphroditum]|uniref:Uncharacterized protein n=1 Tax=Steinernema hermaphroditum TaxID=289476 RepID=A0AA39IFA4_9BILA|nr:hypothetical protein QR680_007411 [Steinernema hermaphroditum]